MSTSLAIEGKTLSRKRDMVEAINRYFVSVGPKPEDQIKQNSNDENLEHIDHDESSMIFTPVDCNYVRKAIQELTNGKELGPNKIPIMLIKDDKDLVSQP